MRKNVKTQIKEIIRGADYKQIKVRLDHRTFITLSDMASLKVWLKRYPDATVITS